MRIGLVDSDKYFFFHRVLLNVIIIYRSPHLSFMLAPVHVAVYRKHGISRIIYFQQPYLMLAHQIPGICILRRHKTENQRCLICIFVIVPQLVCRHKGHNRPVSVYQIGCIRIRNPQKDPIFAKHLLCGIKDLFHRTVIVQQISGTAVCHMPYPEIFLRLIKIRLIFLSGAPCQELDFHGNRYAVDLLDHPAFSLLHLRIKISPGHMVIIRVYRHMLVGGVITFLPRLQR